jgi:hypothetical protein
VPLTRRALLDLRNSALAIGVYALITRVYRATRQPVPLSAADVAALDPAVLHGAATRAIQRLLGLGYLLAVRSRGRKSLYTPAWGLVGAGPRPLDLGAPCLGRPRHLSEVRLPQRLLDTYLGRLEPHPNHAAIVTRYITLPLLGLADVGAYALAMAGLPAPGAGLARCGLLHDGAPQALPADDELLGLVAQRRIFSAGEPVGLTAAGLARAASGAAAPAQPIGGLIPPLIGEPIGAGEASERPVSAPQRPRGRLAPAPAGSHGVIGEEEDSPPTPRPGAGGGGLIAQPAPAPGSPTETSARLLSLGVRSDIAAALAGRPLAQVERLIREARARPGVRSLAAWVVSALRALPDADPAAVAPPPKVSDLVILTHRSLTNHERVRWLTRFRAADMADRPAILARFHSEHPAPETPDDLAPSPSRGG